jgi:hypothetical protein
VSLLELPALDIPTGGNAIVLAWWVSLLKPLAVNVRADVGHEHPPLTYIPRQSSII